VGLQDSAADAAFPLPNGVSEVTKPFFQRALRSVVGPLRSAVTVSWEPLSGALKLVEHNRVTRRLRITFPDGSVYEYRGVGRCPAESLEHATDGGGSVGKAFHAVVRGRFPSRRVGS
jgi:hypothetical protein